MDYNFLDWLESNFGQDGIRTFAFIVAGVVISLYLIWQVIPYLILSFITFLLVLFNKNWNDIKRDKFLWSKDNFIYRKVANLYDSNGYCVKTLYYKWIYKNKIN